VSAAGGGQERQQGDGGSLTDSGIVQLDDAKVVRQGVLGFLSGAALLGVCNLAGASAIVQVAAWVVFGVAVEVTSRRVHVSYRRDPSTPTGPVPATLGEFRPWTRRHFRTVSLPLAFPPPVDSSDSRPPRAPRTWFGRHADRQRQIIRREFAARGYTLPD